MSDPTPPGAAPPPPPPPPPPPLPLPGATSVPPGDAERSDAERSDAELAARLARSSRRRRVLLAVVGLIVVGGLVASMVLVRSASSGDDAGDAPGAGARPVEPPTDTEPAEPAEPATEAEVEAVVAEISAFVEQERGLEFLEAVDVELAGEGAFQDRLLADFDEDAGELRETEVVLEGLGLVEPEVDLVDAMRTLLGGGVVGFYDPETAELVVRGAALTPYVRTTIAHELTHALDDQHFDLDRDQYDDADDEISFGFTAVVEGNARRIEAAYHDSLSEAEQEQADEEELSLGGGFDLGDIPLVLVDLISAPYALGEVLVDALVADGGDEALAAAFDDPPRTSEQVLDPSRYTAREPAVDVPHPQVDGEVVSDGQVGQLLVLLALAETIGFDDAQDAAAGWGGDWGVAWLDGGRSCMAATFVGDDVTETEELRQAFDRWAGESADTVEATVDASGGGPFTVRSCVA